MTIIYKAQNEYAKIETHVKKSKNERLPGFTVEVYDVEAEKYYDFFGIRFYKTYEDAVKYADTIKAGE